MPSIDHKTDRHGIIDRRDGEYICFPDVLFADGRLIVAYNEADRHVTPDRRALRVRNSMDNGATWSEIIRVSETISHCPRLVKLQADEILISDISNRFYRSTNNGLTWKERTVSGLSHDMLDRIIDLGEGVYLTTGHTHRGTADQPAIRQAPPEQMVFRSDNQGQDWLPISVIGRERNLALCEASMILLPDGRIAAIMRENSFVYEPMYVSFSDDAGDTWSTPAPTPLIGHRPTMGLIPDGRLLITYRNVGPDMGTCAWLGSLEELLSDFKVQGRHENPANPVLTKEGLRVRNHAGANSVVRYALRPFTDPRSAKATLEAEIKVDQAEKNGCGLRLGVWWRIGPDYIQPEMKDIHPISIPAGQFNIIRLEYDSGRITLFINNEARANITVEEDQADTRPIMFGAPYPFEENAVDCTWKRIRQSLEEPWVRRCYRWEWRAEDGLPDQWALDNILELKNDRYAAAPDFGYSGWTALTDDAFFCVHHFGGGTEEGYKPLFSSHIIGTRFYLSDFKNIQT